MSLNKKKEREGKKETELIHVHLYLGKYLRELRQLAEFYQVEPGHISDPFAGLGWAGLQV